VKFKRIYSVFSCKALAEKVEDLLRQGRRCENKEEEKVHG
jgi:hypothetical protein